MVHFMYGPAWDYMSSEYDNSVENNSDPVILGYISEEMRITSELCKNTIKPGKKYTIIDMGSGTGRVLFSLQSILGDSVSYCGLDASESMVKLSQKKQSNSLKISFLNHDVTDPAIDELFDDSAKIVMCMYNTIGIIPADKRQSFFDGMVRIAGDDGLVIISAFNGDDFAFVAPRIYTPMKKMVKQIDENSFDEKLVAFKNNLGYYSQWFTKKQILELLHSQVKPIPINVIVENNIKTMGHVFSNRLP